MNVKEPSKGVLLTTAVAFVGTAAFYTAAVSKARRRARAKQNDDEYYNKDEILSARSADNNMDTTTSTTTTVPSPATTLAIIKSRRSIFPKQYSDNNTPLPRTIIQDMLEAARWAPSHHVTEPWHFEVLESDHARAELGHYLVEQYKQKVGEESVLQAKCDKKFNSCMKAKYVIGLFVKLSGKNPAVEEVCSVAAAVQNMHLVASAYQIGAYWSTSGVYDIETPKLKTALGLVNPPALLEEFLTASDKHDVRYLCLGWMFVGEFDTDRWSWPEGRRKSCNVHFR